MTALETLRAWLAAFPEYDILSAYQVDYTDRIPDGGGVFPSGLVEVERRRDICGNVTVTNEYHFGLYRGLEETPGGGVDTGWVTRFREWVLEQSMEGLAPVFGDAPGSETVTVQDGVISGGDGQGTAVYVLPVTVRFKKG